MVLKFSQQMKHAQRTEKYIRLIFNSYISDDDFFSKVHAHYRHELVFFWRFSRPRGGAHYATLNTVYQNCLGKIVFPGFWSGIHVFKQMTKEDMKQMTKEDMLMPTLV